MTKETKEKKSLDKDIEENKLIAALSYVWILCLVPLLTKRKSKFAQFHAKQGLILFAIEVFASFIMLFPVVGQLIALVLLVISVVGFVKALSGEWWKIPYIYEWSKKINL
jgi:uncharacterized membrane protein